MRQKEQKFWDSMRGNAPTWTWLQRVENGVNDGMPDVYGAANHGTDFWLELKAVTRPARASTRLLGDEGLRQSQVNWHLKAARFGVNSWIAIRDSFNNVFLVPGRFAAEVDEMSVARMEAEFLVPDWTSFWGAVAYED